jgi:hypothetical protein
MHHDHIGPGQLLDAVQPLADERAVMRDELQVEVRDAQTRVAVTGRRAADALQTPAEGEVRGKLEGDAAFRQAQPRT